VLVNDLLQIGYSPTLPSSSISGSSFDLNNYSYIAPTLNLALAQVLFAPVKPMAVAKLPPNQRLALILRYEEGVSYADIAAALGVSVSAVRSLLAGAKRTLRRELAEFEKNLPTDRHFFAFRLYY
jgi:Sigma-70, region 4